MLGPQTSPCQTRFFRFFRQTCETVEIIRLLGLQGPEKPKKPKKPKKPMSQIECWVPRNLPVRLGFFGFFVFFCFLVEYQGPVLESVFSKKCPKQPKKPKKPKKPMSQIECWVPRHLPVRLGFFSFFGFFCFLVEYQGPVLESVFSKKCPKQP